MGICAVFTGFNIKRINYNFFKVIKNYKTITSVMLLWNNINVPAPKILNIETIISSHDYLDNKYHIPLQNKNCSSFVLVDDDITFPESSLHCLIKALKNDDIMVSVPLNAMRNIENGKSVNSNNAKGIKCGNAAIPQFMMVKRKALQLYSDYKIKNNTNVGICDDFSFSKVLYNNFENPLAGIIFGTNNYMKHTNHQDSFVFKHDHIKKRNNCRHFSTSICKVPRTIHC